MQHVVIPATSIDNSVAKLAAQHTNPLIQNSARSATWAADGRVLGTLATAAWIVSRAGNSRQRAVANHLAATVGVAVLVPKIMKRMADRTRPDRVVVGHDRRGVKRSGKPGDSFPSGHSVHIGAVVSALSLAYPGKAPAFWTAGAVLAATRVGVLAHWTTDVLAGLALGIALERGVRRLSCSEISHSHLADRRDHSGRDCLQHAA
jgi:membrane-associated phospholipid phosphatase